MLIVGVALGISQQIVGSNTVIYDVRTVGQATLEGCEPV